MKIRLSIVNLAFVFHTFKTLTSQSATFGQFQLVMTITCAIDKLWFPFQWKNFIELEEIITKLSVSNEKLALKWTHGFYGTLRKFTVNWGLQVDIVSCVTIEYRLVMRN